MADESRYGRLVSRVVRRFRAGEWPKAPRRRRAGRFEVPEALARPVAAGEGGTRLPSAPPNARERREEAERRVQEARAALDTAAAALGERRKAARARVASTISSRPDRPAARAAARPRSRRPKQRARGARGDPPPRPAEDAHEAAARAFERAKEHLKETLATLARASRRPSPPRPGTAPCRSKTPPAAECQAGRAEEVSPRRRTQETPALLRRVIAICAAQHRVAAFERIQDRLLSRWPGTSSCDLAVTRASVRRVRRRTTRITAVSGPRPKAPAEGRARSRSSCCRHRPTRRPAARCAEVQPHSSSASTSIASRSTFT